MDILSIMRSRYTTKHYDPSKPVSEKALQTMLEVLRLSPSSVNSQPWHFTLKSRSSVPSGDLHGRRVLCYDGRSGGKLRRNLRRRGRRNGWFA